VTLSLKPYPEYKDSGLPWLGKIPSGWSLFKTKYLFTERSAKGFPEEPLLAATQTKGVVPKSLYENRTVVAMKDLHLLKLVDEGDYVISLRSFEGGIEVAHYRGIISPAYTVLQPTARAQRDYFDFLFKSRTFIDSLSLFITGIREGQNIDYERFSRAQLPVPPKDDQEAIGRFLRLKISRINELIRAKRRVIELLGEQKKAIIRSAITRGLHSSAPLKLSGIDWMGEIPSHWETVALKRVLRRLIDCEHKTAPATEISDYLVVRTSAVRNGELRPAGTYCTPEASYREWTRRGIPERGDVIFTREAPAGEACIVPEGYNLCLGQRTVLLKLKKEEYDSDFLVYMIYAGPPRDRIQLASQGSTVGHFNVDDIGWMRVLKPPVDEQRETVEAVKRETYGIDLALSKAEQEITLVREYRTRLLTDVVTGKFDVRGVDLKDWDVAEKPELLTDQVEEELDREELGVAEEGEDAANRYE
jgi:type I restriction enzyme, S subunit